MHTGMFAFANRTTKELLRDPLNLAFGLGFPLVLLVLLNLIQRNVPVSLFELETLTPGIAVFGLSFISLFSGMLVARDRCGSFLIRLFSSPMRASDFLFGYVMPLLPLSIGQGAVCFTAAMALGLRPSWNILLVLAVNLPACLLFIAIGLLCGSLLTDKQVGGICGALLTNLSAWLSGIWFDVELVGGVFSGIANALPFSHAVKAARFALSGETEKILPHLLWVIGYAVVLFVLAVLVFRRKMKD